MNKQFLPFLFACRESITPYASICRTRCHRLHGPHERRAQVVGTRPLQPAGALHLRRAGAPLAPRVPVQQRTSGLPPPPPVHEQEDGERTVKVATLRRPVSVSCLSVIAGQHADLRRFLGSEAPLRVKITVAGGRVIYLSACDEASWKDDIKLKSLL